MMTQEKTHVNYVKEWTCRAITMAIRKQGIPLRNSRGMSLVELIVVCAIVAVLCSIAIPAYTRFKDGARESGAMSEIRTIELAINSYLVETGALPADLSKVKYDTLIDPWGNHFYYAQTAGTLEYVTGTGGVNTDFDLWSTGKDGSSGTALSVNDNLIVRARNGAYVGLAKNYGTP
jgi:prepilin-type N-terminal cleavage/methylation domain-containing protein